MRMFQKSFMIAISLFLVHAAVAAGGDGTRGGGDAVQCKDGKFYSWDFVQVASEASEIDPEYLRATSAEEILRSMANKLGKLSPWLALDLMDFMTFNKDPFADNNRLWIEGKNPLVDVNDETEIRVPVNNCLAAGAKPKLYQAVIRQASGGRIVYESDAGALAALRSNHPLQLSFLYIHEFLRDYSADATLIRRVNQLLHRDLSGVSQAAFARALDAVFFRPSSFLFGKEFGVKFTGYSRPEAGIEKITLSPRDNAEILLEGFNGGLPGTFPYLDWCFKVRGPSRGKGVCLRWGIEEKDTTEMMYLFGLAEENPAQPHLSVVLKPQLSPRGHFYQGSVNVMIKKVPYATATKFKTDAEFAKYLKAQVKPSGEAVALVTFKKANSYTPEEMVLSIDLKDKDGKELLLDGVPMESFSKTFDLRNE